VSLIGTVLTLVRRQFDNKTNEDCGTVCTGQGFCLGASYCKNMNSIIQDYIQNGSHYFLKYVVL